MRRMLLTAAGIVAAIALAAPAHAEFGAFARDDATGKYGFSWNEASAKQADDAAIKGCDTSGCRVVFRTSRRQCGAIALTDDGKIWGGAKRDTKSAAELASIENCQKRTKLQCKVRGAECNR